MIDLSNVLPGWRAVEKIGEGSYGKVYKCVNDNTFGITDECAVKIISIPTSENEIREVWSENPSEEAFKRHFREIVENFANEIKLMLTLNGSPNVVTIRSYKIVEHQNKIGWDIYICMDYLQTFTKYARQKTFSEEDIRKFGSDICSALEVCSKYGIIHRDIKPDNIFVDKFGNYRLGDFGVAKQLENSTLSMTRIGTMRYMAPEVYDGRKYDARADIYSLGMVMYKLLNNGRDPLTDPHKEFLTDKEVSSASEMRRRGAELPPPCNASRELARIILKACEFNPDYRYSSASEFKKDLESFVSDASGNGAKQIVTPTSAPSYAPIDSTPVPPRSVLNNPVQQPPAKKSLVPPAPVPNPAIQNAPMPPKPPVQNPPVQNRVPYNPPKPPAQPVSGQPVSGQAPPVKPVPLYQEQKKKKSGGAGVVIAVILSIVALLVIGLLVFFIFNGKNKKDDDSSNQPSYVHQEDAPEIEIFTNGGSNDENSVYADYYRQASEAYNRGDYKSAAILFGKAQDYSNAESSAKTLWEYIIKYDTVSAGHDHTVAIKTDGRVVATGHNLYGQCNVSGWSNVVSVSAGGGHTVGLRADGTVVAAGWNDKGQCNVGSWRDIVAISAGAKHTVGLKKDGTVVATGLDLNGRCNTGSWDYICAISAGSDHTVALKADGTVVAVGYSADGQCNVSGWRNIKSISAGTEHTVGLTEGGTVVATGHNKQGECNVTGWTNVRAVYAKDFHTIAVKNDGSLLVTGNNDKHQLDISNVSYVDIDTGWYHTVILEPDGTLRTFGSDEFGQKNADYWSNIKMP